ncbi:MAG TPA: DUF4040 domain-containing protein [Pseudolabrys sp.]|jgi:uncharacterized MnhB-related membrane protein|nr:DUF4040 domain-containing protein [Pseudolabrys sp.]
MMLVIGGLLVLLSVSGLGVVLTREPRRQVLAMAANGLVLSALFMALQAPDVAFSEIVIGSVALPLFFFVSLSSLRANRKRE